MPFKHEIIEKINGFPSSPGVYIFYGKNRKPLYVGKAKNIKQRTQSYLRKDFSDWKEEMLKDSAETIEVKEVETELAALVLEAQLIQAMRPKFNILLKNKNPFIYFFFSDEKIPKFELERDTHKKGLYVGPFINRGVARQIHETLIKIFGLRICSRKIKNGCLYYHLGQCAGFCKDEFDLKEYKRKIAFLKDFFEEGPKKFLQKVEKEINALNKKELFEEAFVLNRYADLLKSHLPNIENAKTLSDFCAQQQNSQHIWLFDEQSAVLFLFENQNNHLKKKDVFMLKDYLADKESIMRTFYQENPLPVAIFYNFKIEDIDLFSKFLFETQKNSPAFYFLEEHFANDPDTPIFVRLSQELLVRDIKALSSIPADLKQLLKTKNEVVKIDCFDISHHQELAIVGVRVRFNGQDADTSSFKKFKIQTTKIPNDYQSMKEVVYRCYAGELPEKLPDLVLIDGGIGQLNSVRNIFPDLEFASLAKREETIFRFAGNEKIVFKLDLQSQLGLYITKIRNRTHDFAVSYHRLLKNKKSIQS